MRKILTVCLLLLFCSTIFAQADKPEKAIIYYEQRSPGASEIQTDLIIYFDGDKKAMETFRLGSKRRLDFFDGKDGYTVLFSKNTAKKIKPSRLRLIFPRMYFLTESEAESQYVFEGTKQCLDKECKVYSKDMGESTSTHYFWNGLMLKREWRTNTSSLLQGDLNTVATKVEVNVEIPKDKFEIPTGFQFIQQD